MHNTVQLTYALVFGTLGPMLQAVFNLTVLYQRDFQLCQQVRTPTTRPPFLSLAWPGSAVSFRGSLARPGGGGRRRQQHAI